MLYFHVCSIDNKALHRVQNPKEALTLCNQEEKLSSERKHAKGRVNHV